MVSWLLARLGIVDSSDDAEAGEVAKDTAASEVADETAASAECSVTSETSSYSGFDPVYQLATVCRGGAYRCRD